MHNLSTVEPGKEARLTVVWMPEEYVCVCVCIVHMWWSMCVHTHACMQREDQGRGCRMLTSATPALKAPAVTHFPVLQNLLFHPC